MHHFAYRNGALHAEDADLHKIAADVGTPFYCYSEATLRRHAQVFQAAFQGLDFLAAYSLKANSNLAVVRVLASEGMGADIVSGGELRRALAAGMPASKIVFSGVGKTREEMALALAEGIYQFNVESAGELTALNDLAVANGVRAPIAFRVNPDVAAGGHEKISTGKAGDKFGVPWRDAQALYAKAAALPGVAIKGVDIHIGSQITDLAPFETAFEKAAGLVRALRADGHPIERLDLGGGLGISYGGPGANPPHPDDYSALIRRVASGLDVRLIFEPGRMIAGNAGVLVAKVLYVKESGGRRFLILDAGMNDLIRPAFYGAFHDLQPLKEPKGGGTIAYDIVGPVCESSDIFAKARPLPEMREGDLVAFMTAGAYGAAQASQYNSRPLAPEVLVNGERYAVVRDRPSFEEMTAGERTPGWLA